MDDDEYIEDEEEIDLESITDEQTLIDMLDETEDFDERKKIRDHLMKVQHEIRAKRGARLKQIEDNRDLKLKKKLQDADEKKQRTMAMYDQMAKTKVMDINIYKYNDASSRPESPAPQDGPKKDLVEDGIRQRAKEAELRKKRILAAYDHAAKTGPAGAPRFVNFTAFKRADVSDFVPTTQTTSSCTFSMSGGISKTAKAPSSQPGTPVGPKAAPNFKQQEEHLDPMERAIRERKREADERKRRTLAAYDIVAKTGGAGPKVVVLEEFRDLKVTPDMKFGSTCDPTAAFRGGVLQTAGSKR